MILVKESFTLIIIVIIYIYIYIYFLLKNNKQFFNIIIFFLNKSYKLI